jgi:hypothetical protein
MSKTPEASWHVKKAAKSLVPGDWFVWSADLGGEGEHLKVEGKATYLGTVEIWAEDLDHSIDLPENTMVTMVVDE